VEESCLVRDKKKRNVIIIIGLLTGACLAGAAALPAVLHHRNPLAAGLEGLAEEAMAWEAELGENFWTDAVNQIGNGKVQAEYSFNVGGIPGLQNMSVGLDGEAKRDMEQRLFTTDLRLSVTNAEIAEASVFGTEDLLFVQVPSVWDGSVVFDAENVSGQWDGSFARAQLQRLTGEELGIDQRIDARMLQEFSVEPFSVAGFFQENAKAWKALYENMEAARAEKAQKEGMLSEGQAESLEGYEILDGEGNPIEADCYLVILPEKELGEIFSGVKGDIRLGVYLDQDKRIVRISTLPGERLVTGSGEMEIGLNLTGASATIDRLDITISGVADIDKTAFGGVDDTGGEAEIEGSFVIEKVTDKIGSYEIEGNTVLKHGGHMWELSGAGSVQGERSVQEEKSMRGEENAQEEGYVQGEKKETGEKLSLSVDNLVLRSSDEVVGRCSGNFVFEPLAEEIELPVGKEYQIGEMGEMETAAFLAECAKNIYRNYSGYLKMLQ